ncbi:hypothetical protein FB45DRAFT_34891 [Roridomyces roridus]|uniref:F-box domain-containing protein n=1 Tax=Roridomyces roridus TaxID=1738132 RepID=A0AAD7G3D8_9AGAR|nr:hypothetical protein FB45DRAFT_34891 [Roridomyces roridus]
MTANPLAIPELLDHILAFLDDPNDLCASTLVQRSWVPSSQSHLFSHIVLARELGEDGFDALGRLLAILRASQRHVDLVRELVVVGLHPGHLEHLRSLTGLTFGRLTSLELGGHGGGAFSDAESLTIQAILRIPSLVSVSLHLPFGRWQDFTRIWDRCSRSIRHVACGVLVGSVAPPHTNGPVLVGHSPQILLESFQSMNSAESTRLWLQDTTFPFDLSTLKAIKLDFPLDTFLLDVLPEALESVEILSTNNWQGIQDLSRFRCIAQLDMDVVTSMRNLNWAFLRTIAPERRAHIRAIRFHVASPFMLDPMNQLLSELQNHFPNLKVVDVSYLFHTSPLEELQLNSRIWPRRYLYGGLEMLFGTGKSFEIQVCRPIADYWSLVGIISAS